MAGYTSARIQKASFVLLVAENECEKWWVPFMLPVRLGADWRCGWISDWFSSTSDSIFG